MLADLPLTLTVEEAADVLRISRGSAYEGIRSGEIPHVRIGRTIRVPRHMLLKFLGVLPAEDDHPENGHAPSGPGGPQLTQEDERDSSERVRGASA